MPISDWPPAERPREKLLSRGADALSDAELLAIFLRTGTRGKTAIDLARGLLAEFGGLRPLLESPPSELCRVEGLGQAKYVQLQAALELGRRYLQAALFRGTPLRDPEDSCAYLAARLRGYPFEVFACLFLDTRHRPVAFEELFRGTIDGANVHVREVVKRALDHRAAAVILAHNHPSGVAEPSASDRALTQRLQHALALVDIRVLDHVVIGDQQMTSFASRGWL
jgi:DNA repair protein RadC